MKPTREQLRPGVKLRIVTTPTAAWRGVVCQVIDPDEPSEEDYEDCGSGVPQDYNDPIVVRVVALNGHADYPHLEDIDIDEADWWLKHSELVGPPAESLFRRPSGPTT